MNTKINLPLLLLASMFLISCQDKQAMEELTELRQQKAIEESNMELLKKNLKFIDESNYDSLRMNCADDFMLYMGSNPEGVSFDNFLPNHKMFYSAFPDYKHEIELIMASGDYVMVYASMTATHEQEFWAIPATGNKINYKGVQICKIKDGKVQAVYAVEDDLTLMTQLGLELK